MLPSGKLLAWIETLGADEFIAAFVGEGALPAPHYDVSGRAPATQLCSSIDDARQWIQDQAKAFNLPVQWMEAVPSKMG
jgi:hypothetical protein